MHSLMMTQLRRGRFQLPLSHGVILMELCTLFTKSREDSSPIIIDGEGGVTK